MNYTYLIFERNWDTSFTSWREEFDSSKILPASALVMSNVAGVLDPFCLYRALLWVKSFNFYFFT